MNDNIILATLPFGPNSLIQIQRTSKFEIHSSQSYSTESSLLLWNLFHSFNRDEAAYSKYLFMSQYHTILQLPLGDSGLFSFLTNPNAIFPTVELVFIKRIKSSYDNSFNLPSLTNFLSRLYHLLGLLHICSAQAMHLFQL